MKTLEAQRPDSVGNRFMRSCEKTGFEIFSHQVLRLNSGLMIPYVYQLKNLSIFLLYDKDQAVWEVTTFSSKMSARLSFPEVEAKHAKIEEYLKAKDAYEKFEASNKNFLGMASFLRKNPHQIPEVPEGLDFPEWHAYSYRNNYWVRLGSLGNVKAYMEFAKMVDARMEELNETLIDANLQALGFRPFASAEAFFEVIGYQLLPDPLKEEK